MVETMFSITSSYRLSDASESDALLCNKLNSLTNTSSYRNPYISEIDMMTRRMPVYYRRHILMVVILN